VKNLKNHNPLQRRPLTPAEYAQLHLAAQSKASWLLRDHHAALEAQMAEARAALEADVTKAEAGMEPMTTRLKRLTSRRSKLMAAIRTALTENAELELLGDRARGVRVQMGNVREAVARMEDELAEAQADAQRIRARLRRLTGTTERKKAEIEIRLAESDGGRRLLEAADEVDAIRRRKAAEKAGAVNAAVSA
jgi:chromosome segregation ATPase